MEDYEKLEGGSYYADCELAPTSEYSKKDDLCEKLFNLSEKLVGFKYNI